MIEQYPSTTVEPNPTDVPTDERLIREYQLTRSEDAFAELVHRYESELFNYLRRYLGDSGMAEDVFQATFLQVHLNCEQFEYGRKLRPWLYRIATNRAIDALRKGRRHRLMSLDGTVRSDRGKPMQLNDIVEDGRTTAETQLEDQELGTLARRAVNELPDSLRTVVLLVYFQGMKYREAAQVLSLPVGTVKSRMHTAIGRLYKQWPAAKEKLG